MVVTGANPVEDRRIDARAERLAHLLLDRDLARAGSSPSRWTTRVTISPSISCWYSMMSVGSRPLTLTSSSPTAQVHAGSR